ncbi:MAG TPA: DinB family protein [Ohtaekwangia sp.]|uniref:DinB family protein n=1 Tax=Ohtaekwangia sp. TaxID=2066019 RepID=UPI002F9264DC
MTRPDLTTVAAFYKGYVENVKDQDMLEALTQSNKLTVDLVRSIPESKGDFRYQPGKWSIKELLCHMIDVERIFAYRALRFARNDKTPLHGFEENDYAPEANAANRNLKDLADEQERLRATTVDLYKSFTPEMLQRTGTANKTELSVFNLGYIIAGHETHHRKILQERYL